MAKPNYELVIQYMNGSSEREPFTIFEDARDHYLYKISYTGGRIKRVELHSYETSIRAIWDESWTDESKFAGLYH
jgi:hypothetical protein